MKKSNRRKYRRRRQTAGAILFGSISILLLSGLLFSNTKPEEQTATLKVQRLDAPNVANAPAALKAEEIGAATEERASAEREAEPARDEGSAGDGSKEERSESEEGAASEPAIPEPNSKDLYLTVPKMGLTDNYVANTEDPIAMDNGAIKIPSTGFPWQRGANTYIAAHVLGYAGTGSYMQFAGLPSMTYGDVIYLTDANGTVYEYAVTEILTVYPQDNWVTDPVPGKDMISLQTCVNPPAYDQRLVVRAERTDVQVA